jgi:hypothetical protein
MTKKFLALVCLTLTGCAAEFMIENSGRNLLDGDNIICEPFTNEIVGDPDYGIAGRIHYLLDNEPRYTNVFDYRDKGHDVGKDLFMNNVYVPTRSFTGGFTTSSGLTIQRSDGEKLVEFFSLHLQASLTLDARPPADVAGDYQLAVISDDGTVIQVNSGSGFSTLIDNNGDHPSMLGCATSPIRLDPGTELPIKIDYYQGPKTHIALALMWRKWPSIPGQVNDPLCGTYGNNAFWNWSNTPSTPLQNIIDLESRGWKALRWKNFKMPAGMKNQCAL